MPPPGVGLGDMASSDAAAKAAAAKKLLGGGKAAGAKPAAQPSAAKPQSPSSKTGGLTGPKSPEKPAPKSGGADIMAGMEGLMMGMGDSANDSPRSQYKYYQVITWMEDAKPKLAVRSNKATMQDLLRQIGVVGIQIAAFAGPQSGPPLQMRRINPQQLLHQQDLGGKEGLVCHIVAVGAKDHMAQFYKSLDQIDTEDTERLEVEHDALTEMVVLGRTTPNPEELRKKADSRVEDIMMTNETTFFYAASDPDEIAQLRVEAAFPIGTRVELHSIVGEAELNGMQGVVLGHTDEGMVKGKGKEGRVVVDFGGGYRRAVPREKCIPVLDTPPQSPRRPKSCAPPEPGKGAPGGPRPMSPMEKVKKALSSSNQPRSGAFGKKSTTSSGNGLQLATPPQRHADPTPGSPFDKLKLKVTGGPARPAFRDESAAAGAQPQSAKSA